MAVLKDKQFNINPRSCQAYWKEGVKCSDWEKGIGVEFRCFGEEKIHNGGNEGFIKLKFKFAIDFDTITPSTTGESSARYKLKEITDREAYDGGLVVGLKPSPPGLHQGEQDQDDFEKAMKSYYTEILDCGPYMNDPPDSDDYSTWEQKKEDFGNVFLICKELWWEDDEGGGVGKTLFATENDACYTMRGFYKSETNDRLYEKGEKINGISNSHGPHVVPACYGLPDFKDKPPFDVPRWQREAPHTHCMPPLPNEYGEDVENDDGSTSKGALTNSYQIFWHGGSSGQFLGDFTSDAIKAGEGDYPNFEDINPIFWNAIPDEEYELSIRHDLYVFPNFIREDKYGTPVVGVPEFDRNYQDIRDVLYTDVNKTFNLPIDGQTPYRAGCNCGSAEEGSTIPDDPFADINLNYLAGIQPDYTENPRGTQRIRISSAELFNLSFCSSEEYIRTIEFDNIRPTTLFGVHFGESAEEEFLKLQSYEWVDYIQHGQYSVFHVSFQHKSNDDHPNKTITGCHDQVSYHFAFAMNLKDVLNPESFGEPDPKFYTGEGVSPEARSIKLYHPSMKTADISAELEYPGELWVKGSATKHPRQDEKPQKQCIYLQASDEQKKGLYSAEDLELPPNTISTHRGIAEEVLGPDFFFGGQHSTVGLTLLAQVLECGPGYPRDSGFTEQSTLSSVHNLHLKLGFAYAHNNNARVGLRTSPWSHFGSDNPEG